ncbi:MAG: hypothetical protein BGO78_00010 [Chloroflexi bacterium 44-23]|nr:MAG: hypothetical protein BGO78_00010 [Chloroflexi bacterium 44-23]
MSFPTTLIVNSNQSNLPNVFVYNDPFISNINSLMAENICERISMDSKLVDFYFINPKNQEYVIFEITINFCV